VDAYAQDAYQRGAHASAAASELLQRAQATGRCV